MRNLKKYYDYKEGVFLMDNDKWIVRIRKGKNKTFATLSMHKTKEEAEDAFLNYYL